MSELFEEVETIPKVKRVGAGRTKEEYDEMFNAIKNAPEGTNGKLKIPKDEVQNYYSALMTRLKDAGLQDSIKLFIRNAKRKTVTSSSGKKYQKLVEGDLYFSKQDVS